MLGCLSKVRSFDISKFRYRGRGCRLSLPRRAYVGCEKCWISYWKFPHIGQMICTIYPHLMIQIFQGRSIPDLYDVGSRCGDRSHAAFLMIQRMCPGSDLYHTDPAQLRITAGQDLDDLDRDLSDLSVRSDLDHDISDLWEFLCWVRVRVGVVKYYCIHAYIMLLVPGTRFIMPGTIRSR